MTSENLKNAQEIMPDIKNIINTFISQQIFFNVFMLDFHCDPSKHVETINDVRMNWKWKWEREISVSFSP